MTKPILSLLIPTTPDRKDYVDDLIGGIVLYDKNAPWETISKYQDGRITSSYSNGIEIILYLDNKELTIGEKRERMYLLAKGGYSWQIDSDDKIAPDAIELILKAIKENPDVDCVTFEEYVNIDGKEYKSNHSNEYADWEGDGSSLLYDGFHFHRTVYFKDVIKTELAKSVPVPRLRWAEDHEYSKLLKPLIRTEFHISEQLYKYIHISSDPKERYGLDK